jgi:hypothetical protein
MAVISQQLMTSEWTEAIEICYARASARISGKVLLTQDLANFV